MVLGIVLVVLEVVLVVLEVVLQLLLLQLLLLQLLLQLGANLKQKLQTARFSFHEELQTSSVDPSELWS